MNIRILICWFHPLAPVIPEKSLKDTPRNLNHNGLLSWGSPLKKSSPWSLETIQERVPSICESAFCFPLWPLCKGWMPPILVFCPDVFWVFQAKSGNFCTQLTEWKNLTLHPLQTMPLLKQGLSQDQVRQ